VYLYEKKAMYAKPVAQLTTSAICYLHVVALR
jgi:hypothetical protein